MSELSRDVKGALRVAQREMIRDLLSLRSAVIFFMMLLLVVGGTYAICEVYTANQLDTIAKNVIHAPDSILFLVSSYTALLVPIAAVVLSFDGLAFERTKGTMALLLVKPLSREALALGKFLGALGAVSVLILISSVVAIAMIGHLIGSLPSLLISVLFVVMTILLAGAYIGITMAVSVKAKAHGDAVMAGIAAWLLFTLFWLLFPLGVSYAMGWVYDASNPTFLTFSNRSDAFNPNGVYNLCLATASGNWFITMGVDPVFQVLSALLWFFIPFVVFIIAFGRSEG